MQIACKEKNQPCSIANHFADICSDPDDLSKSIKFIIIDLLNNTTNHPYDEVANLLIQNERLWILTLVTIHEGLISIHYWNKNRGAEQPKQLWNF